MSPASLARPADLGLRFALGLGLCLALNATAAEKKPEKPPLGTQKIEGTLGTLVQTVLPGEPIAAAPLPGGGLAVLIAPETAPEGPRHLYRLRDGVADLLLEVPKEIDTLAAWPHAGIEARELWLGEPGRIFRLAEQGRNPRLETLLEVPGLLLAALADAGFADERRLTVSGVGWLRFFLRDESGTWRQDGQLALPISARRLPTGLEIATPKTQALRLGEREVFLVGPQQVGPQRLRSFLIDPAAPAESRQKELWSRLPADEELASSFHVEIEGRPYLVALTANGVFAKLFFNLLPLREDRTRAGSGPSFRVETESRQWFAPEIDLRDLDEDGRLDLVLIESQGLSGNDLWLSVWRGQGQGRFEPSPERLKLDHKEARWAWGQDLNGDQLPDLLVESEGRVLLHAGRAGKKVPAKQAAATLAAPALSARVLEVTIGSGGTRGRSRQDGAPALLQLDRDETHEAVLLRHAVGRAVVRIVEMK